jgi:hypothetical protein
MTGSGQKQPTQFAMMTGDDRDPLKADMFPLCRQLRPRMLLALVNGIPATAAVRDPPQFRNI